MKKSDDETRIANIVPFGLRLQPDLKRRVEEAAKRNNRSLNAEIALRLEMSLTNEEAMADAKSKAAARNLLHSGISIDLERRVEELERRLDALDLQNGGPMQSSL